LDIHPNRCFRQHASDRQERSARSVQGGVRVTEITTDEEPGQRVYDPSHPDADDEGFVTFPNVNMVVEMTNMISATRSYEANLAVVDAAKNMAFKALDIGR
jgi:flagellar basal-body rod protein FlgC